MDYVMATLMTSKRNHNSESDDSFVETMKPAQKKSNMADVGEMEEIIESLKYEVGELNSQTANLKDSIPSPKLFSLVLACICKQQTHIDKLTDEVIDLKKRSMRNNILVHNVKEHSDQYEDTEQSIRNALEDLDMNLDGIEFENSHRIGKFNPDAKKPRTLIAKCQSLKMTKKILKQRPKRVNNKGGKKNGKQKNVNEDNQNHEAVVEEHVLVEDGSISEAPPDKNENTIWVSPQYPPEVLNRRRRAHTEAKKQKEKNPNADIHVALDKLVVNGQVIKPAVITPGVKDVLDMSDTDRNEIVNRFKFVPVTEQKINGVTLRAFRCTKALKTIDNVRAAYKAFLMEPDRMKATHNAMAYKCKDSNGYCDDGSVGIGKTMIKPILASEKPELTLFLTQYHHAQIGFEKYDKVVSMTKTYIQMQNCTK